MTSIQVIAPGEPEIPPILNSDDVDSCTATLNAATRELRAFCAAVRKLYGATAAQRAASHWLEVLGEIGFDSPAGKLRLRPVTVHAANRLSIDPCMYNYHEFRRKKTDDCP